MRLKSLLSLLGLGLTFTLSLLPITTTEADCVWRIGEACEEGEVRSRFEEGGAFNLGKGNRFVAQHLPNPTQRVRRKMSGRRDLPESVQNRARLGIRNGRSVCRQVTSCQS